MCLFIAIMLAATAYDVIWIQWPKWQEMKTVTTMLNGEVREDYEHKIMEDEVTPLLGEKVSSEHKPGNKYRITVVMKVKTDIMTSPSLIPIVFVIRFYQRRNLHQV